MQTKKLRLALLTISIAATSLVANAQITGSLWENTASAPYPNAPGDANANTTPIGAPDVTFSLPNGPVDFDSRDAAGDYTIGGFLASGGATILTGGGESGHSMNNVIIQMRGFVSVTTGENFTVEQDDGLDLTIDGLHVVNNPGGHSPTAFSGVYNGPDGDEPFLIQYIEIDGAPAVLDVQLPLTAPDSGSTVGLLGLGMVALSVVRSKFKV